jgi:hypothetical protein
MADAAESGSSSVRSSTPPARHSVSDFDPLGASQTGSPQSPSLPRSATSILNLNVDLNRELPPPPTENEAEAEQEPAPTLAEQIPPDLFRPSSSDQLPDLFQSLPIDASPTKPAAARHLRSNETLIAPSELGVLSQAGEPTLFIPGLTSNKLFARLPSADQLDALIARRLPAQSRPHRSDSANINAMELIVCVRDLSGTLGSIDR